MKKILLSSSLIIFAAGSLVLGSTGAFFSDTETSSGNTFTAGAIDLKIDNESYYNGVLNEDTSWSLTDLTIEKFFSFDDIKPNDYGEDTISLHVDTNDAYLCADVTLTSNDDNTQTEPEALDDPNGLATGELTQEVNFIWWADDGDNVLEDDEEVISSGPIGALNLNEPHKVALADSENNIWTGEAGPVTGDETFYIGKAWCFGDLSPAPLSQDGSGSLLTPAGDNNDNQTAGEPEDGGYICDGSSLNNSTQTDSLTVDVSFSAVQARHNPDFLCITDTPPVACEVVETYADEVVFSDQGLRKNNTPVTADRSNTSYALGAPQSLGTPYDSPVVANSFFSLGFPLDGNTAEIVLSFNDNFVVNNLGNDLKLWEVTGGTTYPDERVDVYVGDSPVGPWTLVGDDVTRDAEIDFDTLAPEIEEARYVRIVDASNLALFEATADGYDLDAVQALNCVQRQDF